MALDASIDSPGLFRHYIERNAQYALSLIDISSPHPLSRRKLTVILQALQYTLALPELWPSSKRLLMALAPQMELLDLRVLWLPYLREGLRQSIAHGDLEAELSLRYYLGNFLREANAYDEALAEYARGIELADIQKNMSMKARLLNRAAFALRQKGDLQEAEAYAKQALALAADEPVEQGYSNLVLGAIEYDRRHWETCLTYSSRALEIWLEQDARRELAWAYTNLGIALWRQGNLEGARENLERAIKSFEMIGDIVHQASAKMNMGVVLIELNKPEQALTFLAEAEKVFHVVQNKRRLAMVANNLAHVYQAMANWDDAIDAYQQSISLWQNIGKTERALNVTHSLISLLIKIGQIERARKLLLEAQESLASIEGHPNYRRLMAEFKELEAMLSTAAN